MLPRKIIVARGLCGNTLAPPGARRHDRAMRRRFALLAVPALFALVAAAPASRQAATPLPDIVRVALTTEKGVITVDIDAKHAPVTAANFVRYVDQRRFDGITFYRAMHLAWGAQPNGLVQAGQRDPRRLLPPIAHEPTSATGLLHKAGALSMARNAPGTAAADFSILLSDMPGLDADPASANPESKAGYAVFGNVSAGMEVVRAIWDAPRSPTLGEGVMKGQMLAPPVRILTARRVTMPASVIPAAP
jgi:peptidyl-prolyl cis-trans isomerase A (cyclophilin A)